MDIFGDDSDDLLVVERRGHAQPAALLHAVYPPSDGKRQPLRLLLLAHLGLLLVTDWTQDLLLFRFDIGEAAGTLQWTLCDQQKLKLPADVSLAFHATSNCVILLLKGESVHLRYEAGKQAVLEAPQLLHLQLRVPPSASRSIAVDSRRNLLAVAHDDDKVYVYPLTPVGQLSAVTPLLELSICTGLGGVCFDSGSAACILFVASRQCVEYSSLAQSDGT